MSYEKDYYMNAVPFFNAGLALKYDRHIVGEENILDIPAMYAINHLRFDDSLLVAGIFAKYTGKPLRFGGKIEYFEGGGIDDKGKFGAPVKWFVENTHQIPVERESNPRSFAVLSAGAKAAFDNGDSVALHPEGTRSRDGRLNKFKSGVARIAIANQVPIVPVALVYTPSTGLRRNNVDVMFGEAMMPEDYNKFPVGLLPMRQRAEFLSNALEEHVAIMSGQEQSHEFATLPKDAQPEF